MTGFHRIVTALILAGYCLPGWAHLCDNVFRQADKLIVKPETYNLVVKDKTTFKVFLQNNMDRGIADISLVAESPAFDFAIKPQRMAIQKDQRTYFEVTMTPKASVKTGNYNISFRLVGGDDKRLFKSFSMKMDESEAPAAGQAPTPASAPVAGATPKPATPVKITPTNTPPAPKADTPPSRQQTPQPAKDTHPVSTLFATARPTTNTPVVDGKLTDPTWKRAAVLSGFSSASGGQAVYDTTALFTFDKDALHLGVLCNDEDVSILGESDFVEIVIAKNYPETAAYSIKLTPGNTASFKTFSPDKQGGRWIPSGLSYAVEKVGRTWSVELAIPFSAIGAQPPRAGEKWQMRINRTKTSGNPEQTFWSADERGANSPKGFGVIGLAP